MLQFLSMMALMQMVACAIFFPVFYSLHRSGVRQDSKDGLGESDVLIRGKKVRAFPTSGGRFSFLNGFAFSTFFYWLSPVWIWRYGAFQTLWLIAGPFLVAFLIANFVVVPALAIDTMPDQLFAGAIVLIPLRIITGFYVGKMDSDFRRRAHLMRGWTVARKGFSARSVSEAVQQYRSVGEVPKQRWSERIRKLLRTKTHMSSESKEI